MQFLTRSLLHAALMGVMSSAHGLAADYFVSTTGKDTNSGSISAPWLTIQRAANVVKPGDHVYVRGGTYRQRMTVKTSGTAAAPIEFSNYQSEVPILDLTGVAVGNDLSAIILISGRSYVTIRGFTLRNYRTVFDTQVPVGILIEGGCKGVKIIGNTITQIEQNDPTLGNFDANAHGIAAYGTASSAIDGLEISGNSLSALRLGASEAIALNGNVTNFLVSSNTIQNCNNIAIDVIGYEETNPNPALDRARNGRITANVIQGIDTSKNPAYGGNLTTGGGYYAAAGIYVDGGTQVTIDRNDISGCNYGIELASETNTGKSDFITVKGNLVRNNYLAGIILGGYDEFRGATENCTILNNTLYQNGTKDTESGQIAMQFYARKNLFMNNIIWAGSASKKMIDQAPESDTASRAQKEFGAGNVFSYNLYYAVGGSDATSLFRVYSAGAYRTYKGLAAWKASGKAGGEVGSTFGNPKLATPIPASGAAAAAFKLLPGSPAINTGHPTLAIDPAELDFFGVKRLSAGRVDRGASEQQ